MSTPQYEATPDIAPIQHGLPDQARHPGRHAAPRRATVAIVIAAAAIFPAAFWSALALFVWGWLAAGIVAIVALVVSILTLGLLRSAGEIESPDAARSQAVRLAA